VSEDSGKGGAAARRAVLAGAGLAGVLAALAGCGTGTSQQRHPSDNALRSRAAASPTGPAGSRQDAAGSPPDAAGSPSGAAGSPSGAAGSTANPGSTAAGQDLGAASGIPVGGGKVFDQQRVVVTQPVAGQFKAFSAVCPHRGCLVSAVSDGVIRCRCHGSLFSASDGSVEGGPSTKPLPARTVTLRGGDLILL
jgi:Rieske Fe-S protein